MLENITTETQSFQFGTTDLAFVLCLNRHKDASGEYKSSKYIVESCGMRTALPRARARIR